MLTEWAWGYILFITNKAECITHNKFLINKGGKAGSDGNETNFLIAHVNGMTS